MIKHDTTLRDAIMYDAYFQIACQSYAHESGSSAGIAGAAVNVIMNELCKSDTGDLNARASAAVFRLSMQKVAQLTDLERVPAYERDAVARAWLARIGEIAKASMKGIEL